MYVHQRAAAFMDTLGLFGKGSLGADLHALCENATVSDILSNQACAVDGTESLMLLWRNSCTFLVRNTFFSFIHTEGFWSWTACLGPVTTSQRGAFVSVFWVVFLLQNPCMSELVVVAVLARHFSSELSVRQQNSCFYQLSNSSRSWGSRAAPDLHYQHHNWLLQRFCCDLLDES